MGGLSFARCFRLRPGAIECDADGLRVGGVALLARDARGAWTRRDGGELNRELSKLYGLPLDCERKGRALDAVAAALTNGELARAQIGALLLRLPDPPEPRASTPTAWKSAVSSRASGLQPSESGRRLGRKAPENRRAAQPRLVRPDIRGAGRGRAEVRRQLCGGRPLARRRDAGLRRLSSGGRRRYVARRRPVGDRLARAGGVGRSLFRRDNPVRRDLRAERQPHRRGGPHSRPSRRRLSLGARRNRNCGDPQGPHRRPVANPGRRRRSAERPRLRSGRQGRREGGQRSRSATDPGRHGRRP